jgi:hypothetical protein
MTFTAEPSPANLSEIKSNQGMHALTVSKYNNRKTRVISTT